MQEHGYSFMVDSAAKFFNSIFIHGWFHHETDRLKSVSLSDDKILSQLSSTGLEHGGVANLGHKLGFRIQVLRSTENLDENTTLIFETEKGIRIKKGLFDLCKERIAQYPTTRMLKRFQQEVRDKKLSVLDIGGRARSGVERKKDFDTNDYVVLDILPGDSVDVVGDAHKLASLFPKERFDAIFSNSVFEHLMMPWTVVTQMNEVMKMGAIGLISTHQTLGIHDAPWDFWRFSDTAWGALFNKQTGFEIVERTMDFDQYIIPFIYRPHKHDAERSAGFENSAVWVRKIGPCQLSWPVTPNDINETMYPDHDDGYKPDGFGAIY